MRQGAVELLMSVIPLNCFIMYLLSKKTKNCIVGELGKRFPVDKLFRINHYKFVFRQDYTLISLGMTYLILKNRNVAFLK